MTATVVDGQMALAWEDPATGWRQRAEAALTDLAGRGDIFTAWSIALLAGEPESANAWGGLLSWGRRQGLIVPVGWTTSDRPTVRKSGVRTWRGAA